MHSLVLMKEIFFLSRSLKIMQNLRNRGFPKFTTAAQAKTIGALPNQMPNNISANRTSPRNILKFVTMMNSNLIVTLLQSSLTCRLNQGRQVLVNNTCHTARKYEINIALRSLRPDGKTVLLLTNPPPHMKRITTKFMPTHRKPLVMRAS